MFVANRVPNCRALTRNRIYGFMKRLVYSSKALTLSVVTSDARYRSRIVLHWLKLFIVHFDGAYLLASEWLHCLIVKCYTMCSLGLCSYLHMCLK